MLQYTNHTLESKEYLLDSVKKEVKKLIEESVTKTHIRSECEIITKLCASIEACLSHGLKRRVLGLFKTSSTTALLHKIAKYCSEAQHISNLIQEIELNDPTKKFSWSSESVNPPLRLTNSAGSITNRSNNSISLTPMKHLWIRLALYEKCLVVIIDYLVQNAANYYDKDALLADRDYSCALNTLLTGLNALELLKTENFSDELMQRHYIKSLRESPSVSSQTQIIHFKPNLNTNNTTDEVKSSSHKSLGIYNLSKDNIESVNQNVRQTLLYDKDNVHVLPKDCNKPLMGNLSLYEHPDGLVIKWTPNHLIHDQSILTNDVYWKYALYINVNEIVYVHCHQTKKDICGATANNSTLVFVSHDGVQWPPIIFPESDHLQQFLNSLETGLLPYGQLDPPLWTQKGFDKIFSWPKSMRKRILPSVQGSSDNITADYVFRIVSKSKHEEFAAAYSILDFVRSTSKRTQLSSCSTTGSSDYSSKSLSMDQNSMESPSMTQLHQNASIEMVCSTMRLRIISRAFYGWLAYCRHLSTIRTHLSGLVHKRITPERISDKEGLTLPNWQRLNMEGGIVTNSEEVFRLVYYGGIVPELRKHVWPYLLGHYTFGSTHQERLDQDEYCRQYYETTMSEWLAVEAIVLQKDKEKTAEAIAKLSSESTSGQDKTVQNIQAEDLDNEVFEEGTLKRNNLNINCDNVDKNLTVQTLTRVMTKSTDSGHIDDTIEYAHSESELGREQNKSNYAKEEENESTPSTSSYNTPDNYQPLKSTTDQSLLLNDTNSAILISSEYYSVDDTHHEELKSNNLYDVENLQNEKVGSNEKNSLTKQSHIVLLTEPSQDVNHLQTSNKKEESNEKGFSSALKESPCVSPISSNGGIYSNELLETFGLNLHRIEKDVQRCDRNFWYFANNNLDKLRNVITTYVWEHLTMGYMQGMCDLVAPLLVILDDEALAYNCFCKLMERMADNFPHGNAMDLHFINIKFLVQILDPEMYDLLNVNDDQTHLYFCYRWFLLDFKRELLYDDIFSTWEVIWAAKHISSNHFVLFFALALLETYRDEILANNMDFTDVIKFFNEMAERHNAGDVLQLARNFVLQLQIIIENK